MLDKFLSGKITNEISMDTPVPDFIPYACHYDASTILTKNGELLQVIKVTGFSRESVGSENMDLREVVRKSIRNNIKSDDFSLWFHTVRRKKNLDPGGKFEPGFSSDLNKAWKRRHNWDQTYVNEVYITVLRDGNKSNIFDPKELFGAFYFSALQKKHEKFLESAHKELNSAVNAMLKTLSDFGAKRLGVVEHNDVFYSEPLQFFSKILNLAESPFPMSIKDISEYIADHGIAFGFNTMEVKGKTGKHFGMIFTIKEYHELSVASLDKFLQLPQEFIVTQTIDFINCKKALKEFKKQKYILDVSQDRELAQAMGLEAIIKSDNGSSTAFGDSQITIFLMNDSLKKLEQDAESATSRLAKLGIVATRRDLRMEECFWSQLPGNFSYLTRKKPISTSMVGGFASLFNFPAGQNVGNLWGPAVTMFHTAAGTPYFFNFHDKKNGHTAIIGPKGGGKTVLLNFMVSEARKFGGKLFFFDQDRASRVFINSLGGCYIIIKPTEKADKYSFNPMHMEDSPENRKFLKYWIKLLAESDGRPVSDREREHLDKLIDYIYTTPVEKRRLSLLAKSFGPVKKGSLGERMSVWHGKGKYAHLFDNDMSNVLTIDSDIYGFGMSGVVNEELPLVPVLSYIFHRIEATLDGSPSMIVLDEAWNLVNNPIFAPKLTDWLQRMREKNAVVIFATETVPNDQKNEMTSVVANSIATQIFLPNPDAEESSLGYKNVWGLSDVEYDMLARMRSDRRHFMLRQAGDAVVATLNLDGMKELEILSGGDKTATIMEGVISEKGEKPQNWLPEFYKRVKVDTK